jgi:hypothetical protein
MGTEQIVLLVLYVSCGILLFILSVLDS